MHFVRISFENVTLCLTLAFIFFKTFKPLIFFNHEQKIKNQGLLRTKNQFQVCFQGFEIGLLKFKGFQDVVTNPPLSLFIHSFILALRWLGISYLVLIFTLIFTFFFDET